MGLAIVILLVSVFLYFIPTIVGWRKKNIGAIFILNLLLGWTFVGWVVALVWALVHEEPHPSVQVSVAAPLVPTPSIPGALRCSKCGAQNPGEAQFCLRCGTPIAAASRH